MGIADYLYNVVDAIPGERGGYADALVTLLGGDSKRQRRNQNIQAAMALFGANPSQQEIQAFADNEFQPAMPEGAGAEYGPRLNQLQETAKRNAGLVEAAQLATSAGSDSIKDVFDIWKMRQLQTVLGGQRGKPLTPEQEIAVYTDGKVNMPPFDESGGVIFDKYRGTDRASATGRAHINTELAKAGLLQTQGQAVRDRTQSQNTLDTIRGNTQKSLGGMYDANRGLSQERAQLEAWKRQIIDTFTQIPGIDPNLVMDVINGKSVSQKPQWFVMKGKDGKNVRMTGTLDVTGKPIVQQPTFNGQPIPVPKDEKTPTTYEYQSLDKDLELRFPHSTPQQRMLAIKGDSLTSGKAWREMQDAEEAAYDADVNDTETAAQPEPQPTSTRAAVGGGRSRDSEIKKANEAIAILQRRAQTEGWSPEVLNAKIQRVKQLLSSTFGGQ